MKNTLTPPTSGHIRLLEFISPVPAPKTRREGSYRAIQSFTIGGAVFGTIEQIDFLEDTADPEAPIQHIAIAMKDAVQAALIMKAGKQDVTFVGTPLAGGFSVRVSVRGFRITNSAAARKSPLGMTLLAGEFETVTVASSY